jgi:hypothetical protein
VVVEENLPKLYLWSAITEESEQDRRYASTDNPMIDKTRNNSLLHPAAGTKR